MSEGRARKKGGFTSDTARAAGKIGGAMVSRDREHMRRIGKKGALEIRRRAKETGGATAVEDPPVDEVEA
jgi:hypothetical protein